MSGKAPNWGKQVVKLIRKSDPRPTWKRWTSQILLLCAASDCLSVATERLETFPGHLTSVGFCAGHAALIDACVAALDALDGPGRAGGVS